MRWCRLPGPLWRELPSAHWRISSHRPCIWRFLKWMVTHCLMPSALCAIPSPHLHTNMCVYVRVWGVSWYEGFKSQRHTTRQTLVVLIKTHETVKLAIQFNLRVACFNGTPIGSFSRPLWHSGLSLQKQVDLIWFCSTHPDERERIYITYINCCWKRGFFAWIKLQCCTLHRKKEPPDWPEQPGWFTSFHRTRGPSGALKGPGPAFCVSDN